MRSEQRRRLVTLGDIDQIVRNQPVTGKAGFVAREAAFVFYPTLDKVERDAGQ